MLSQYNAHIFTYLKCTWKCDSLFSSSNRLQGRFNVGVPWSSSYVLRLGLHVPVGGLLGGWLRERLLRPSHLGTVFCTHVCKLIPWSDLVYHILKFLRMRFCSFEWWKPEFSLLLPYMYIVFVKYSFRYFINHLFYLLKKVVINRIRSLVLSFLFGSPTLWGQSFTSQTPPWQFPLSPLVSL